MTSGRVRIAWLMAATAAASVPLGLAANIGRSGPFLLILAVASVVLAWASFSFFQETKISRMHAVIRFAWLTGFWSLVLVFTLGCLLVGPFSSLIKLLDGIPGTGISLQPD